ncbi:hypothetical protein ACTSEZ_01960 [Metabacillus sp. JX24]|uniref:hypothetical protein n=1 Tax=Metabacillus sp. JX24 TaxID=3240759 RepID=UPI0035109307
MLVIITAVTAAALAAAYWLVFKSIQNRTKAKTGLVIILFLFSGSPVIYALYDEAVTEYADANIGLGLSFMTTWFLTLAAAIAGIVLLKRKKRGS